MRRPEPRDCGVLFVAGDKVVMKHVFASRGHAYWSAAFGVMFEKHGWVEVETAAPTVLANPELLDRYELVVVAWLPEEQWRPEWIETLERRRGLLFLEGPLPERLAVLAGLRRTDGQVMTTAVAHLAAAAADYLRPEPRPAGQPRLRLAPREILPRPDHGRSGRRLRRRATTGGARAEASLNAYLQAYDRRMQAGGSVFPDSAAHQLAGFACAEQARLRDSADARRLARAITAAPVTTARAAAIRAATIGLLGEHLPLSAGRSTNAEEAGWRAIAAATGAADPVSAGDALHRRLDVLEPRQEHVLLLWLAARSGLMRSASSAGRWLTALAADTRDGELPSLLAGWGTPSLLLLAAALRLSGEDEAAIRIRDVALEDTYDRESGFCRHGVAGARVEVVGGFAITPTVAIALVHLLEPHDKTGAATHTGGLYEEEEYIRAWHATPYGIAPYEADGAETVVELRYDGRCVPGIVRRGEVIATSFQLLAYLVWMHTLPPLTAPARGFGSGHGNVAGFEHLLFHLLRSALMSTNSAALRVARWPWGARFCLTVRHDVDRIPDGRAFERLLELETREGVAATWFWLPDRRDAGWISRLVARGHEVALHAVWVDEKGEELAALQRSIPPGYAVVGEALHGPGDGSLGYSSVKGAADAGLLYTDAAAATAEVPCARFPALQPDGSVICEDVVGMRYISSTDTDPSVYQEGAPNFDSLEVLQGLAEAGWHCQVLNHPDMNYERLATWLGGLPRDGRVDWNCAEVARWWRTTHGGRIRVARVPRARAVAWKLETAEQVDDLVLLSALDSDGLTEVYVEAHGKKLDVEWERDEVGVRIRLSMRSGEPVTIVATTSD